MHSRTFAYVFGLSVLTGISGQSLAATVFSDNFDSGASSLWGNEQGGWAASAGVYDSASPRTVPNARSSLPFDLTDFSIDFDVNNLQDGGVWLRSTSAPGSSIGQAGVLLVTGGRGLTGTGLYWHIVPTDGSYGGILNESAALFVPGVSDAHLHVQVQGDTYSVFVNGASTPATTLTTSSFAHGQVALYDFSPQTFDNVVVSAPVPEPATSALCLAGLAFVGAKAWSARRRVPKDVT